MRLKKVSYYLGHLQSPETLNLFVSCGVTRVPTYVASGKYVSPTCSQPGSRKRSCDDDSIAYNSLMTPKDYSRRFSELAIAQDVLAANQLEKIYQLCRKQQSQSLTHGGSEERLSPQVQNS